MAKRITIRGKRFGVWTAASLLLTTVGCGFPHGRYGGDPMLGSFNRPIAATPPIFTGGDPGVSPAWDAQARMGLPSPDVPAVTNPVLKKSFVVPTFGGSLGLGGVLRGNDVRAAHTPAPAAPSSRPTATGNIGAALLPAAQTGGGFRAPVMTAAVPPALSGTTATASVAPRMLDQHTLMTSGSSVEPPVTGPRLQQAVFIKDPRAVMSVEEGQQILQTVGARSMQMEPQPTGDWRFTCVVGDGPDQKRYEAKSGDQVDALRAVLWQVKNER